MAESVAREYFGSIRHGTTEPQRRAYADDATASVHGVFHDGGKAEIVAWFEEIWGAVPDFTFELLELVESGSSAAAHWRATGTFAGPGRYQGMEPNGRRFDITGVDVVHERDGRLVSNHAYLDGLTFSRQLGVLPELGSATERRLQGVLNARTRSARSLGALHRRVLGLLHRAGDA